MMTPLRCPACKTAIAHTDGVTLDGILPLPGVIVNALIRCPSCGATRMWRPVATYRTARRRGRDQSIRTSAPGVESAT